MGFFCGCLVGANSHTTPTLPSLFSGEHRGVLPAPRRQPLVQHYEHLHGRGGQPRAHGCGVSRRGRAVFVVWLKHGTLWQRHPKYAALCYECSVPSRRPERRLLCAHRFVGYSVRAKCSLLHGLLRMALKCHVESWRHIHQVLVRGQPEDAVRLLRHHIFWRQRYRKSLLGAVCVDP